jgi:hypothetical protein
MPDEQQVEAAYRQHAEEAASWGSGGDAQFLKFLGPQNQTKWDASVPAGFQAALNVFILPPWAPGKNYFHRVDSHFWKSHQHPQGTSVGCPGPETCPICQARKIGFDSADPEVAERAKRWGRVNKEYLYQVAVLDYGPQAHAPAGVMRPFILSAGATLHKQIGDVRDAVQGSRNLIDPQQGRPVRVTKRKTGREIREVEYAAMPLDQQPLDPAFYPLLAQLYDLEKFQKDADQAKLLQAVQEMGLPMPPTVHQVPQIGQQQPQPPAQQPQPPGYQPQPPSPWESPYGQPPQPQQQPAFPPQQNPQQPPPIQAPPVQSQPVAGSTYQPRPGQQPPGPPPAGGQQMPPPPAIEQPPQNPQQPAAQPPPVEAPSGQQSPIPPAPPVVPPAAAQPSAGTGRPPCFGKYNAQDRTCQECPDQLKAECQQQGQPQTVGDVQQTLKQQ